MVSRVEPDRYADTGFAIKDTPPDINALLFRRMMARSGEDRLKMGLDMLATARAMVRASLPENLTEPERRAAFLERFYGSSLDAQTREHVAHRLPPPSGAPARLPGPSSSV